MTNSPADVAVDSKPEKGTRRFDGWRFVRDKVIAAKGVGPKLGNGHTLTEDVVAFLKPSTDAAAQYEATKAASLAANVAKVRDPDRKKKNVVFKDAPCELIGEGGESCDDPTEVIVPRSKRGVVEVCTDDRQRLSRIGSGYGEPSAMKLRTKMRADEGAVLRQSRTPRPEELDQLERQLKRAEQGEPPRDPEKSTPIDFSPGLVEDRNAGIISSAFNNTQSHTRPEDPVSDIVPPRRIADPAVHAGMDNSPLFPSAPHQWPPQSAVNQSPPRARPQVKHQDILPPPVSSKKRPVSPPKDHCPPPLDSNVPPSALVPGVTQPSPFSHKTQPGGGSSLPSQLQTHLPTYRPSPSSTQEMSSASVHAQGMRHPLPPPSAGMATERMYQQPSRGNFHHTEGDRNGGVDEHFESVNESASSRSTRDRFVPDTSDSEYSSGPSPVQSFAAANIVPQPSLRTSGGDISSSLRTKSPTKRPSPPAQPVHDHHREQPASYSDSKYPDRKTPSGPHPGSISIRSPAVSLTSSTSSSALRPTPALDDFRSRVSHMWRIFSLTADRDGPVQRFSLRQWLRGGVWWFVCARAFFEAVARKRNATNGSARHDPSSGSGGENSMQQLLQGHVDLAKAVWVIDIVLPEKRQVPDRDGRPSSGGDSVQVQATALRKQMEALAQSMGRHGLMPAHKVLIQGLDQLVWVRYPPDLNPVLKPSDTTPNDTDSMISLVHTNAPSDTVFEPLAIIPLADSASRFCLFRSIGRANLRLSSGNVVGPIPVVLSIVRPRGRLRLAILIAGQIEGVSVVVEGGDVSWGQTSSVQNPQQGTNANATIMRLRIPLGDIEVTLPESEGVALRGMYDSFTRAVSPMSANTAPLPPLRFGGLTWPEEVLWEGSVASKVTYYPVSLESPDPAADTPPPKIPFPFAAGTHKSSIFAVVALANRAGLRLSLADADAKAIQVLVLEVPNVTPLRIEETEKGIRFNVLQSPRPSPASPRPSSNQSPESVAGSARSTGSSWVVRVHLGLSSSTPSRTLIDILGAGPQSRSRDNVVHPVDLAAFHIEPFSDRLGDSAPTRSRENADEIPCNGAVVVEEVPPPSSLANGTSTRFPDHGVRLVMTHHSLHMKVTLSDRISAPVKFRLPITSSSKPEIELLRLGQSDLSASIERPDDQPGVNEPASLAEFEWQSVLSKSSSPSLRLYRCATMDELHLLESSLTGWLVKYDGRPRSITFPRYSTILHSSSGTERSRRPTISLRPFHHSTDKGLAGSATDKKAPVISFSAVGPNRVQMRLQLLQHRENPERFIGLVFFTRREDSDGFGAVPPSWVVFGFKASSGTNGPAGLSGVVDLGEPAMFGVVGKKSWLHRDKEKDKDRGDKDRDEVATASPSPHVAFSVAGSAPAQHLVRVRDVSVKAPGTIGCLNLSVQQGQAGTVSTAAGSIPNSPVTTSAGQAYRGADHHRANVADDTALSVMNGSVTSLSNSVPGQLDGIKSPGLSPGSSGELSFSSAMLGGAVASGRESDVFVCLNDTATNANPIPGTPAGTVADVLVGFETAADRKKFVDVLPI